jgi:hypothetical protein
MKKTSSYVEKIGTGMLKTLGWTACPELMIARYEESRGIKGVKVPIFCITSLITMGITFGIHEGYTALTAKKYSTKNIQIEIKKNTTNEATFLDFIAYVSPLTKLIQVGVTNDLTKIKSYNLEVEMESSNLITYTKNQGFSLNKEACYTNDFRIKYENEWIQYNLTEIKNITSDYEKIKSKREQIREKAIESGNIGEINKLEDKIIKLQSDYEFKRAQLKQTQNRLEKEMTDIVNKLNTEYLNYKNTPATTAIPGRDYDLSNITK